MLRFRFVPLVLAVVALVASALVPASTRADAPAKLVVSWGTLEPTNTPLWVALKAGYFQKNGLDVDLRYVASTLQVPALLSGDVQIAQVGGPEVAAADASGSDLEVLATLGPSFTYFFMVPNAVKSLADMKGKAIAISKIGDAGDTAVHMAFRKLGIDPKDYTFVQVGSSTNRFTALLSGSVAATIASPGLNVELEDKGYHALFDMGAMNIPAANITIVARRPWVEGHRDIVQRYLDAIVQGIAREKADKPFTVAVLKEFFKSDNTKAMTVAYDYFTKATPSIPYPRPEQYAAELEYMSLSNSNLKGFDMSKYMDDSFLRESARKLKIK
jgi:NitT/TauT family transport system substrate-binding protein